jgi:Protein of unknown function (DUF3309)
MTGYEQSPDYGDPESGWHVEVCVALVVLALIGATIYALNMGGFRMSLSTLLAIVLFVALVGSIPNWPWSKKWGYGPAGILALLLVGLVYVLLNYPGII